MCGIAGIMRFTPGETPPPLLPVEWIRTLDESVKHRGPDGRGVLLDRVFRPADEASNSVAGWLDVALIHRRLAIIDIEGGAQPMVDPPVPGGLRGESDLTPLADDALAVVFKGCIYNHRELRAELIAGGAKFQTDHSDTEVLLHGYRAWGEKLPERLEGMFAFVIWDRARGEMFSARDRAGEKPLFCGRADRWAGLGNQSEGGIWVYSSQQAGWPALVGLMGGAPRLWAVDGLISPLCREVWRAGLVAIGPAERLRQSSTKLTVATASPSRTARTGRAALDARRLDALIAESVRARLEADVPLGCLLSGGVDSSIVAAHARAQRGDLRSFCVRMPDARYDESGWAEQVAAHLGTKHTTLECRPHPLEDLERLIPLMGMPFNDSSLLPTYWLCSAVAAEVKVALSGDGGDELFGGYERYVVARWPEEVKAALAQVPAWGLDAGHPKSRRGKLARLVRACRGEGYLDLLAVFPSEMRRELLGSAGADGPGPSRTQVRLQGCDGQARAEWPEDPLAFDFEHSLPWDMLRKVDAASMAAGLEVRAPLLASTLIEAAFDTPLDVLMPPTPFGGRRLKGLLKDALRLHLPDRLIDRPKSGFAIPIGEWFRSDYGGLRTAICDILASTDPWPSVTADRPLNLGFCRRILDEHLAGRRDHGQRLYVLLVLHLWDRWLRGVRGGGSKSGSSSPQGQLH